MIRDDAPVWVVPSVASTMMTVAGAVAGSGIVRASVASLPEGLGALWRAAGWVLKDAAVVDARHLVLVFFVDHGLRTRGAGPPGHLAKFTDNMDHAPYRAKCLKLATLRHYREQHQDLEGTWDPMEGRSRIASSLEEMCRRHGLRSVPHGAHHVAAEVTYQTDDASFIYCASRSTDRVSRHVQWSVASRIHDVPNLALLLGAEFARQRDDGRHAPVTGLDWLVDAVRKGSGLGSVAHVYHGPVVYDDEAGDALFARVPELARGLAAHFFKRKEFENQKEYRFVVSAPGGRPIEDEFYLRITPELRSVFERLS